MVNLLEFIQKLSVVVFLLSSMFGAGLSLTLGGLAAPLSSVRLVLFALLLNFVFAPGLAWLLTVVIPLQREHAIAMTKEPHHRSDPVGGAAYRLWNLE